MSKPITIAIIEDDLMIAQMYRMKLESEGFDVNVAASGKDGVAMIATHRPDIILLDVQLPEMDGSKALRNIRALPGGQDIPVIILTNLGKQEAPRELDALGIEHYIVKADLTPRQVVERIKNILDLPAN